MTDRSNRLPVLAAEVKNYHAAAVEAVGHALEFAIKAGEALIEAKQQLPHGRWLPWLREHCDLSERTAQRYMRLAKHKNAEQIRHGVSDLSINAAIETLTNPLERPAIPLPEPGMMKVGWLGSDVVMIAESTRHAGYFWCSVVFNAADPDNLVNDCMRRPIRHDGLADMIEWMTRQKLSGIEWTDRPTDAWLLGDGAYAEAQA